MTTPQNVASSSVYPLLGRIVALTLAAFAIFLFVLTLIVSIAPLRVAAMRGVLTVAGAAPPRDAHGFTNILLLGVGDKNHDGADLTDTMMIASIDPLTRSAVLLSIPRDLYLSGNKTIPDGRINTMYFFEKQALKRKNKDLNDVDLSRLALRAVGDEMGEKLGIAVHGVVKADFTAFENTVDALGGVDVVVTKKITDYSYPVGENRVGLFELDAGPQHLDGQTALRFARSRHGSTDFDRSARQQQLLQALSTKIQTMSRLEQISSVSALLKNVVNHVDTTFTTQELLGITQIGSELSMENLITMQINYNAGGDYIDAQAGGFVYVADPALYEGASVLVPSTLPTDKTGWGQMRTFAGFLVYQRALYLNDTEVQVVNVSANTLAASRLQNELRRYGLTVTDAPKPPKTTTPTQAVNVPASFIIFNRDAGKQMAGFFGGLLHMDVSQQTPTDATATGSIVRIVLGKDFTYQPFQTLVGTGAALQ